MTLAATKMATKTATRNKPMLTPGLFLRITIPNENGQPLKLKGTISQVTNKNLVLNLDEESELSFNRQKAHRLPGQADLECIFSGTDCRYRFQTKLKMADATDFEEWLVDKPEEIERVQMRNFVRVPVNLTMEAKFPQSNHKWSEPFYLKMVDISGGGICFLSPVPLAVHTVIRLQVPTLPQVGILQTTGRIERCQQVREKPSEIYRVGLSFDQLTSQEQDKLISSIFEIQRRYLQNGVTN